MKHKQKDLFTYGLALLALVFSLLFWTRLVLAYTPLKYWNERDIALFLWDQGRDALGVHGSAEEVLLEPEILALADPDVLQLNTIEDSFSSSVVSVVKSKEEIALVPETEEQVSETEEEVSEPVEEEDELTQWELRPAYEISIPSLGLRGPVLLPSMSYWSAKEWDLLEQQMQVGLNHGAVAYPQSVRPGALGTLFVSGHSSPPNARAEQSAYGNIFARLPELQPGDRITVLFAGSPVSYEVTGSKVVPAVATSILKQQNNYRELKLITCFPIGTTKDRLIVTAKLVEE